MTFCLILVLLGVFLGYKLFTHPDNPLKEWTLTDGDFNNVKFLSEESLVNEIRNVNKIVPLEIEFSETIVIDKSWGNFDVFKKFKKIKFYATCSYSVDLSSLSEDDIKINKLQNEINITLPKPEIFSIDIDENKTTYEESSTGFLRFGDVNLTSEEFGVIHKEVSKSFASKMDTPSIYEQATNNTKNAINTIIENLTVSESKPSINLTFK